MRLLAAMIAAVLVATTAAAQTPYVAGTIGADLLRVDHTQSTLYSSPSGDTEAFSGSLRVGTSISESWGVEFEYVRSAKMRGPVPGPVPLFADLGNGFVWTSEGSAGPGSVQLIPGGAAAIPVPIGGFRTDVRLRHSDFDAVAWARQRLGGSVDMVYLGGVAFSRERVEITQTFPTVLRVFAPGGGTFRTTVIDYSTHPLVGAEARIGLTTHLRLIPGIRAQGRSNGWLLRPYAGLGWFF